MDRIYEHFAKGFERAMAGRDGGRRIGAELKFPLVSSDGTAASLEAVGALWRHLGGRGWRAETDALTGRVVGARRDGERNETVASCETGYCKPEFSLAHVGDLFALARSIEELAEELRPFADRHGVHFLGYGIQPVSPPGAGLLMKKGRTSVWDKVFGANRVLSASEGDDVCLFTVNAASHVHLSVSPGEAIRALNVLNGFAPAQIALTADSSVWRGRRDETYRCVAEKLWDWWMPDARRVGVPERAFADLRDYAAALAALRPVYVKRDGKPVILSDYDSFAGYYERERASGTDSEGREVALRPEPADIDLHSTCCWHNARLTRYFTVENRTNDQQPPSDLVCIAALTLGLVSALEQAEAELRSRPWSGLRASRERACAAGVSDDDLADLAGRMLDAAEIGLRRRGLGEETFLAPLRRRLRERRCPADEAADLFEAGGAEALVAARSLHGNPLPQA